MIPRVVGWVSPQKKRVAQYEYPYLEFLAWSSFVVKASQSSDIDKSEPGYWSRIPSSPRSLSAIMAGIGVE
jgi:hypothetical protein